jgi:hypothetical protein
MRLSVVWWKRRPMKPEDSSQDQAQLVMLPATLDGIALLRAHGIYCETVRIDNSGPAPLHYIKIHKVVYDAFGLYSKNKQYAGLSVWEFVKKMTGAGDGRPD